MKYYELKEIVEDNETELFNEINKRIKSNTNIKIGKYSAGPPDILYFIREPIKSKKFNFNIKLKKSKSQSKYNKSISTSSNKKFGSYLYIYGMDTSNLFSVENYINAYIDQQKNFYELYDIDNSNNSLNEKIKNSVITKAVFCSYDFFIEKDFRIIFNFPDGFDKFYFFDGKMNDYNITEDELRTIFLSSVLRSWNFNLNNDNKNIFSKKNFVFLEEIKSNDNFNALIDSIIYILIEKLEYKYPNLEKKLSIFFFWFFKYLISTRRYSFILTYFSKLSHIDTNLAKFALKPLYYINGYKDGLKFIATLLTCNTNHSLICEEIEFLIVLNKYEDALKLGKYLTVLNPGFNEAWISLAQVYLKLKKYDKCLKALNNLNYLKTFLHIDNINYDNPYIISNEYNKIIIEEYPIVSNKPKLNLFSLIKYCDLISYDKYTIDFYYNTSNIYLNENDDLLKDIISKITNSNFFKFNGEQKKMYYILLKIMKEINFSKFLELKNKLFYFEEKRKINKEKANINEILNNSFDKTNKNINQENIDIDKLNNSYSHIRNISKILINPFFEFVIETLFEDIKLFSLGCFIKEKNASSLNNKNDLSQILNKNNLSKLENVFCITFGILCERLNYNKIALKYYLKSLNYCFSKYVYYRVIKILLKQKDYKNCVLFLNKYLLYFHPREFYNINKTPLWIDKIILDILYEYKANDILSWLKTNSNKEIINFIKKIINKYKEWVENGHEIHLLK